jgi:Ni/Co efflux regulator RcnB
MDYYYHHKGVRSVIMAFFRTFKYHKEGKERNRETERQREREQERDRERERERDRERESERETEKAVRERAVIHLSHAELSQNDFYTELRRNQFILIIAALIADGL